MENLAKLKKIKSEYKSFNINGLEFLSVGVGCHCLVSLESLGLISILMEDGFLSVDDLTSCSNPLIAKACIQTLVQCNLINIVHDQFLLTSLGLDICKNIGLVTLFFDGYGKLLAKGAEIAKGNRVSDSGDFNGTSIAEASRKICENTIDPALINSIIELTNPGETICDLGCGSASLLKKACEAAECDGLGFEIQKELLKIENNIKVEYGDITSLPSKWPNVSIAMQRHVFHDFVSSNGAEILKSYLENFPNLKYFIYVDFVAPHGIGGDILPGFDYIHSLLGIPTPTHTQTLEMFDKAGFEVVKENSDLGMPNTFLWILKPKA